MNQRACILSKMDGKSVAEDTLLLCQNAIEMHQHKWKYFSDVANDLMINAEQIASGVQEAFNVINSKVKEQRVVLENKILAAINEKRIQNVEIKDAISKKITLLWQLKKDLQNLQVRFGKNSINPSAKELMDLMSIRNQIKNIMEENNKWTEDGIAQLTKIDSSIVPEAENNLNRLFGSINEALLNYCCGVGPEQVYLHIQGSTVSYVKENLEIYVVSSYVTSNLFIASLRLEVVNLSTEQAENVKVKTVYENAICFQSSRLAAGLYVINCYLSGKSISNSPLKIDVSSWVPQISYAGTTTAILPAKKAEKYISDEEVVDDFEALSINSSLSTNSSLSLPDITNTASVSSRTDYYSNPSNKSHEDNYTCVTSDGKFLLLKKQTAENIPYFRYVTNPDNSEQYLNENGEIVLEDGLDLRYLQPIIAGLEQQNISLLLSMLPADCNVETIIEMCYYLKVPLNVNDNLSDIRKKLSNLSDIEKIVTEFCFAITLGKYDRMNSAFWSKIYEILLHIFENKLDTLPNLILFHLRRSLLKHFGKFSKGQKERLRKVGLI